MTAELVAAARLERDAREKHYPMQVANGKLTADEATIDFQAWHCIVGFLESGHFRQIDAGGVAGGTIVNLVLAEAAAQRAVDSTTQAQASAEREGDGVKAQRLAARVDVLRLIAREVGRQRSLMESLNRQLRHQAQMRAADAAA